MNWSPIRHYPELVEVDELLPKNNRAGIYIWGFKNDENLFWPYYVGKHWDIPYRLCQHLSSLKGGFYTIYKHEHLFSYDDIRVYNAENTEKWIHFIMNGQNEIQSHVDNMINRFHFTYALIEDYDKIGVDAEKAILNAIDKRILINTRYGTPKQEVDIGNLFQVISEEWRRH